MGKSHGAITSKPTDGSKPEAPNAGARAGWLNFNQGNVETKLGRVNKSPNSFGLIQPRLNVGTERRSFPASIQLRPNSRIDPNLK